MKPKRENNTSPKQSYTPGPWILNHYPEWIEYAGGKKAQVPFVQAVEPNGERRFICKVDSSHTVEHTEANAMLIASAPELLEACKQALKLIIAPEKAVWDDVEDSLRQAIKKAEGLV